jgi:hypothetical protein
VEPSVGLQQRGATRHRRNPAFQRDFLLFGWFGSNVHWALDWEPSRRSGVIVLAREPRARVGFGVLLRDQDHTTPASGTPSLNLSQILHCRSSPRRTPRHEAEPGHVLPRPLDADRHVIATDGFRREVQRRYAQEGKQLRDQVPDAGGERRPRAPGRGSRHHGASVPISPCRTRTGNPVLTSMRAAASTALKPFRRRDNRARPRLPAGGLSRGLRRLLAWHNVAVIFPGRCWRGRSSLRR